MKKFWMLICALSLPFCFLLFWKMQQQAYPKNDEGSYFAFTQRLHQNFKNESFGTAAKELYFQRNWKPILHPVLGLPFLQIAKGDARNAIAAYTVFVFVILLLCVFSFLSRKISEQAAAVGTLLIAFIPWVFGLSTNFNSEITFITAAVGFFVVAHNQSNFLNLKSCLAAAILFSLMITLRPVEALLVFGTPVLLFVASGLRRSEVSMRDFITLSLWLFMASAVLFLPQFVLKRDWRPFEVAVIGVITISYLAALLKWCAKLKLNRGFQIFFGVVSFSTIVWYAPAVVTLFRWILLTNFDVMAIETGNRVGRPVLEFFFFYLQKLGIVPWALLAISLLNFDHTVKNLMKPAVIGFVIGSLAIPLLFGSMSHNGDVRYYYSGWIVACLLLVGQAMAKQENLYRSRLALTGLLTCVAVYNILINSFTDGRKYYDYLGGSFFSLSPAPYNEYSNFENSFLSEVKQIKPAVKILFIENDTYWNSLDPQTLTIISLENNHDREFVSAVLYETQAREFWLTPYYHYVIVGPLSSDWSKYTTPLNSLAKEFVSICQNDPIFVPNEDVRHYQPVKTFTVQFRGNQPQTYCLIRNEKSS